MPFTYLEILNFLAEFVRVSCFLMAIIYILGLIFSNIRLIIKHMDSDSFGVFCLIKIEDSIFVGERSLSAYPANGLFLILFFISYAASIVLYPQFFIIFILFLIVHFYLTLPGNEGCKLKLNQKQLQQKQNIDDFLVFLNYVIISVSVYVFLIEPYL